MTDDHAHHGLVHPDTLVHELLAEHRVQEASIVLTMIRIAAVQDARGWDLPARLFTVRRTLDVLTPDSQLMTLTEMELPPETHFNREVTFWWLDQLADAVRRAPMPDEEPALVGWMFTHEGYMAISDAADVAGSDQLLAAGREHTVRQRPDAMEVRVVLAVDRTLTRYQVVSPRHNLPFAMLAPDGSKDVGGEFIERLSRVMANTPLPGFEGEPS